MGVIPVISWRRCFKFVHKLISGLDRALRKAGSAIRPGRVLLANHRISGSVTILTKEMQGADHTQGHANARSRFLACR